MFGIRAIQQVVITTDKGSRTHPYNHGGVVGLESRLRDKNDVVTIEDNGRTYLYPVRRIVDAYLMTTKDTDDATVELWQSVEGPGVYLVDPEGYGAWHVSDPEPAGFSGDAHNLVEGDWQLKDMGMNHWRANRDGLELVATHLHRSGTIRLVWTGDDFPTGTLARPPALHYIGEAVAHRLLMEAMPKDAPIPQRTPPQRTATPGWNQPPVSTSLTAPWDQPSASRPEPGTPAGDDLGGPVGDPGQQ